MAASLASSLALVVWGCGGADARTAPASVDGGGAGGAGNAGNAGGGAASTAGTGQGANAGASGQPGGGGQAGTPFPTAACTETLLGTPPAGYSRYAGAGCDCELWVRTSGAPSKAFGWKDCISPIGVCRALDIEGEGPPTPGVAASRAWFGEGGLRLAVTYLWLGTQVSKSLVVVGAPDGNAEGMVLRVSNPSGCTAVGDGLVATRLALNLRGQLLGDYQSFGSVHLDLADVGALRSWASPNAVEGGASSTTSTLVRGRPTAFEALDAEGALVASSSPKIVGRPIPVGDAAVVWADSAILALRGGVIATDVPADRAPGLPGADATHVVFSAKSSGSTPRAVFVADAATPLSSAVEIAPDPSPPSNFPFVVGCGRAMRLGGGPGTYEIQLFDLATGAFSKHAAGAAPYLEAVGVDCKEVYVSDGAGRVLRIAVGGP